MGRWALREKRPRSAHQTLDQLGPGSLLAQGPHAAATKQPRGPTTTSYNDAHGFSNSTSTLQPWVLPTLRVQLKLANGTDSRFPAWAKRGHFVLLVPCATSIRAGALQCQSSEHGGALYQ